MARPRGGEWLESEVRSLADDGVDALVSLLTPDEARGLGLEREGEVCRQHRIDFQSFPIVDRSVPASRSDVQKLALAIRGRLLRGQDVVVHCRAGVGRSGVIAACTLVAGGLTPELALAKIAAGRGCEVPDTAEQRAWIEAFEGFCRV
jgi:protein-tyrosine phosphatase